MELDIESAVITNKAEAVLLFVSLPSSYCRDMLHPAIDTRNIYHR